MTTYSEPYPPTPETSRDLRKIAEMSREEILMLNREKKMLYLYALQVKHIKLEEIAKDLLRLLSKHNETNILAVIGATGVGKTTLIRRLIQSMIEEVELSLDSGSVPFIYIAAPANGDRSISWATIYEHILRQADEVLIEKKQGNVIEDGKINVNPRRFKTLSALRDALESMLRHRNVQVIVIDEAFHLLRYGNYSAVMDTIKSLSDRTNTKIILLGSYDLFDLASEYGQVARRAEILHFKRYFADDHTDQLQFQILVRKIQGRWPCDQIPNFESITEELLEASLGCIGILKALLLNALSLQIENNGQWKTYLLAKAAKSVKLLNRIREGIETGEQKIQGATYGETIFSGEYLNRISEKMNV